MNPQAQRSQHQPPTLLAEEMNGQDAGVDCHSPSNRRGAPPLPQNVWKHPLVERAIFLLLLTLLVAPVYAPALNRFLAADQLYYFAELKNDLSLANGLRFLDYNAVRGYWKGDQACYRPLLFAWQALGSSLCGYNYRAWNSANLAFHLLVAYLLFELLRCIQPTVFAGAFALVFSVLTKNCELVMWNHLGGYLLGYAMLLLALLAVQKLPRLDGCQLSFWLAVYALSISTAMLFYEMAVISGVLAHRVCLLEGEGGRDCKDQTIFHSRRVFRSASSVRRAVPLPLDKSGTVVLGGWPCRASTSPCVSDPYATVLVVLDVRSF